MGRILIKNGRVWDGERFFSADVLTDSRQIAKIAESIEAAADYVFDAAGMTVSAGLVDTHVHMKGIASDTFGICPAMSSFPFGVTAVNDAGSILGDRALLDAYTVKSTVFACMDIRDNHADFTATEACLRKYGDRAIGIKIYFDTGLSDVRDLTALRETCSYASEKGLKVMVHCSHSPVPMAQIVDALSPGDILTHIFHGGANGCTEDDFAAFTLSRTKGVIMDAGFAGHVHTDFSNLQKTIRAGYFPDTISTDITCLSAYKRGGRYGMTTCMNLAKTAGMDETAVFRAVTSSPAKALGKGGEWGHLKEGRCADIAVLREAEEGFDLTDHAGNRLQSDRGWRCALTLADGQVVYRD